MFTHVMVGVADMDASKKFYDAVLGALGHPASVADPKGRVFWRTKTGVFGITKPIDGKSATHANGGTIGFAADSAEKLAAFHKAGIAAGGKAIEDPPGPRGDGKMHLLVGQFRKGKIQVFQHQNAEKFAPGNWLQAEGEVAEVPGVW